MDWNFTTDKIAKLISDEFTFSFGDEYMFSLKCCKPTAKNIRDSMDRFIENKRR